MALTVVLNGQIREFGQLEPGASLVEVITALELKGDRIAIEHNGEIAQRGGWELAKVGAGDRLEIVHFVGGGSHLANSAEGGGTGLTGKNTGGDSNCT